MFKKSSFSALGANIVQERDAHKQQSKSSKNPSADELLDAAIEEKNKGIQQKEKQIARLQRNKDTSKRRRKPEPQSIYVPHSPGSPKQSGAKTPVLPIEDENTHEQLNSDELEERTFGWISEVDRIPPSPLTTETKQLSDYNQQLKPKKKKKKKQNSPKTSKSLNKLNELRSVYKSSKTQSKAEEPSSSTGETNGDDEARVVDHPVTELLASIHRRFVTNTALYEVRCPVKWFVHY